MAKNSALLDNCSGVKSSSISIDARPSSKGRSTLLLVGTSKTWTVTYSLKNKPNSSLQ